MYLAPAIHHGEVSVAVDTARVLGADGDEVAVIDIAQSRRHVAEDGTGIHIHLVATRCYVTAGKHGIVDGNTGCVVNLRPASSIRFLVQQLVEGLHWHVFALGIGRLDRTVGRGRKAADAALVCHQAIWLYHHIAVKTELTFRVVIVHPLVSYPLRVVVATAVGRQSVGHLAQGLRLAHAMLRSRSTIDESLVATTEDVAHFESMGHIGMGANFAATDMHVGRAEDIALGTEVEIRLDFIGHIHRAVAVPVVKATTAAEDIPHHMTAIERDMGLAALVDLGRTIDESTCLRSRLQCRATPYRPQFATAIEAAADLTTPHRNVGRIGITVDHIAATKDIATLVEDVVTRHFLVQFLFIFTVHIAIADVAVVDSDVSLAID